MVRQVSNGPYSITTAPSLTKCRTCNRPVLAATISGLDRYVDTATLNDQGELAALLQGRKTFKLAAEDYLSPRSVYDIKAGPPQRPVLAEHACQPVADHHIEHAWTLAAMALIYSALGVSVPGDTSNDAPPPF